MTHPGARIIGYEWNLDGTLATVTHSDGAQRRYGRDSMGRVTTVAVAPTPTGVGVPLATLGYDDDGRPISEVVHAAGGSSRLRGYDAAGRLTGYLQYWDDGGGGWDITGATLGYGTDGRVIFQTRTPGGAETYTYDPAGQLTSVTGGPAPLTVDYGPRGNRTRTTTATGAVDSTYNPNGSIATLSDGNGTASFAYDAAGRRTAVEVVDANDDPLAAITTAYDAAGRTTTVARDDGTATFSTTRSWDGDGNLARLVHSNGGFPAVQDFLWDTTGGLPRVVDSYLYGALHARHDLTNQYLSIELDAGPAGTVLQWYGYDAVGSAVDPNDNPNILDGPDTHDPWGTPTPGITTHPTGLYRGEHRYGDLIHLRARQYHPETAQFTTPDPLDGIDGTPTVANPYHYTDNDPLNKTDPTGMRPSDGSISEGQVGAACDSVGGRLVWWGDTGSRVCLEPGIGEGSSCWPPQTPEGDPIVMHRGSCHIKTTEITCARGPSFLDPICRNSDTITTVLTVIAVGALAVATGGLAAVAIGGSTGIAIPIGGGAAALAGGGSVAGGGAIVLSPAAAGALTGAVAGIGALSHLAKGSGAGSGRNIPNRAHQQKQFEDAWRECQRQVGPLTRAQRRVLHEAIHNARLGYHEILAECIELFG